MIGVSLDTAHWREWYRSRHDARASAHEQVFESYVSELLGCFHTDFINPDPAGSTGDWCDGVAELATIVYACYGPPKGSQKRLISKIQSDFARAVSKWPEMQSWRFVTNATVGPEATRELIELQGRHHATSSEIPFRPITITLWRPDQLWTEVVLELLDSKLRGLNKIMPGVPGAENVRLEDLIPLLDKLSSLSQPRAASLDDIRPVEPDKIGYNELPLSALVEFAEGSLLAPEITKWFAESGDPELQDRQARAFRSIYVDCREPGGSAAEVLELLYIALGGSDFRVNQQTATSVYAVTSYFFATCDLFETPHPGWSKSQLMEAK